MFNFFFSCINRFGLLQGIWMHLQIKVFKKSKIKIPGYRSPIIIRHHSTDLMTFREIFLRQEYAINLPEKINPETIIDAGANVGFTSLFFANRYPKAKIFSLEPEKENFEFLKKNIFGNSKITPIQSALWYKSGSIEIVDKGYGSRGFVVEEKKSASVISIPAITIQDLIDKFKISSIDILKIDIEGSEKEVFEIGAEQWLPITKCLIIELHDRMKPGCSKSVFKAISQFDFDFLIKGENVVFINRAFL